MKKKDTESESEESKGVLERNISSLVAHRKRTEEAGGLHDYIVAAISKGTGSLSFLYLHIFIIAAWVLLNIVDIGFRPFDPNFVRLTTLASVESLFLSMFVLVAQNRMTEMAEKRAELNVQISLLGEHEITRLLILTSNIAKKMKLEVADDPDLDELQKLISPDHVLRKIDEGEKRLHVTRKAATEEK